METQTDEWIQVEYTLRDAKGIAWDTCHKIYILMDNEQMEIMRGYEYDPLISSDEMTPSEMFDVVWDWYEDSCGLRFISAVSTDLQHDKSKFDDIIPQFYKEEE